MIRIMIRVILKEVSVINLEMFMRIISYNVSYFASDFEMFDPWTALMFLIRLWAHSYLLTTF